MAACRPSGSSLFSLKGFQIFTVIIGIFIVTVTFFMGTQLEWSRIKAVLRRPFGPAIGFCCQFFFMPVVSRRREEKRREK